MGFEISRILLLMFQTGLVLLWIVFSFKDNALYQDLVESIDENEYRYPELFYVGFSIMKLLKTDSKSPKARVRVKEIADIKGQLYAEYYFYVINAAKWTYGFSALVLFAILAGLSNSWKMLFFGALLAWLLMYYIDERLNDKLSERKEQLIADLPAMLSQMTLLINSGMTVRDAWKKIAFKGSRALYVEMQQAVSEMQNGVTEMEAYNNFAERCSIREIRRFAATMIQSMQKGNAEIAFFLKSLSDEMWEEKKNMVKRKGEAANSKLMFPMTLIFIGVLIMVMAPALLMM